MTEQSTNYAEHSHRNLGVDCVLVRASVASIVRDAILHQGRKELIASDVFVPGGSGLNRIRFVVIPDALRPSSRLRQPYLRFGRFINQCGHHIYFNATDPKIAGFPVAFMQQQEASIVDHQAHDAPRVLWTCVVKSKDQGFGSVRHRRKERSAILV